MRRARSLLGAVGLSVGVALGPALALDDGDRAATRSAVEGQIEAFRRDDAPGAYAFAAPGIQSIFPSDERFLEMVREAYRPIYRPRTFEFGPVRETETGMERALRVQDSEGVDWDAIYSFERQPDGSWKISGCSLVKRPGEAV